MSEKILTHLRQRRDIHAICIFCFLVGACITLFLFKKDLTEMKKYVDILGSQISTMEISKERMFLYVLWNRIILFIGVFLVSKILRHRYLIHIFWGCVSLIFGIFLFVNLLILGVKGVLSGVIFILPQWAIYLLCFSTCIKESLKNRSMKSMSMLLIVLSLVGLLVLAALLETYVTLPLILKTIF